MSFLEFFSAIVLWYAFGWIGAIMLLTSTVYVTSSLRNLLKLNNKVNINNCFRKAVVWLYNWIDIEWNEDKITKSCIPFNTVLIMALVACLGTYALLIAFGVMVVSFLSILGLTLIKQSNQ